MTTTSWSTRVRHDSDAMFREWGAEMQARFLLAGLLPTVDTGQINWITVTRPGTTTNAGYEIYIFNDSLQATAPIYMRVDYGTGGNASSPRMQFTVGTGSNGAGTLTGTALTIARSFNGSTAQNTDTARNSYACHTEGFFGLSWKQASTQTEGFFFVERTRDSNGAATATGAIVGWGSGQNTAMTATQALRFAATAAAYTARTTVAEAALGISAQTPNATAIGSDLQVFLGWTITPRAEPVAGVMGVLDSEFATAVTFSATPIGSTSRTYLALTTISGPFTAVSTAAANGPKYAMLWE